MLNLIDEIPVINKNFSVSARHFYALQEEIDLTKHPNGTQIN